MVACSPMCRCLLHSHPCLWTCLSAIWHCALPALSKRQPHRSLQSHMLHSRCTKKSLWPRMHPCMSSSLQPMSHPHLWRHLSLTWACLLDAWSREQHHRAPKIHQLLHHTGKPEQRPPEPQACRCVAFAGAQCDEVAGSSKRRRGQQPSRCCQRMRRGTRSALPPQQSTHASCPWGPFLVPLLQQTTCAASLYVHGHVPPWPCHRPKRKGCECNACPHCRPL
mmetsp:Transcript_53177/g.134342  ORF Transcript_53177/g.134342 Transcript_53177/m.134342 type:complete len:222 (+) Transcript_53177:517-1182(+)